MEKVRDNGRRAADLSGSSLVGVVRPGRSLKDDLRSWISVAAARGGAGRPPLQLGAGWLGEGLIGGGVLVHAGPEGCCPELGRRKRVRRARRRGLDLRWVCPAGSRDGLPGQLHLPECDPPGGTPPP